MVNVDFSPSVVLGVSLIGAGVSLWQVRRAKPWISKDYDVVVSCISLLVGGILIFQGWRLDPLLLFGQLMTTGAAVSFGVEALRLRSEVHEQEEKALLQEAFRRRGSTGGANGTAGAGADGYQLAPPPQQEQEGRWGGSEEGWTDSRWWQADPQQQQQQQQQPAGTSSAWDYQQQQYGSQAGRGQYTTTATEYSEPGSGGGSPASSSGSYGQPPYGSGLAATTGSGAAPSELAFPPATPEQGGAYGGTDWQQGQAGAGAWQQPPAAGSARGSTAAVRPSTAYDEDWD